MSVPTAKQRHQSRWRQSDPRGGRKASPVRTTYRVWSKIDDVTSCESHFPEFAGDPAAVDALAAGGGGGFSSVAMAVGGAGSATVVWAAAGGAGGASLGFSTRVELCEKLSAALISEGGATTDGTLCTRDAICDLPEIRGGS